MRPAAPAYDAVRRPAIGLFDDVGHLTDRRATGSTRELDFSPWGGAYNRVPAEATAFAHRDGLFLLKHGVVVGARASAAERASARGWLGRSWVLTHPFGSGGAYPNFPEAELDDWAGAYHWGNRERLLRVKWHYDPDGVFGPGPADSTA